MAKTPPTELQLEVLRWIADGCPAGVMADPKYKVSAYALERRNLARVKRRKNPWTAEITEAGKQLCAKGGAASMAADKPDTSASGALQTSEVMPGASRPTSQPMRIPVGVPAAPAKSATQKMMDRLVVEHVIEFTNAETGRYRQLVTVARRKKLFPDDMELVLDTNWNKPCTVALRRRPEWQLVALAPVIVPAAIRPPHDVVAKLKQQRTDRLGMDNLRWNWTQRIVQGLVVEAERRGYGVAAVPMPEPDYYGRVSHGERMSGHLKVSIGEDDVQLCFSQAKERVPHQLTASELRRQAKGYSVPTEELVKTSFLTIRLLGLEPPFWQSEWTENDATRADSLLPRIIQEIELRAARAVEVRIERQRRDDEKRRQWELARERAICRLNEDHRASVLLDQAERFQRVQLLGDYIAAMRSHIGSMNPVDAAAATDWLHWAQTHARTINPLLGEIRMPKDPKPDADAIKPYMKAWSPYGPDLGRW